MVLWLAFLPPFLPLLFSQTHDCKAQKHHGIRKYRHILTSAQESFPLHVTSPKIKVSWCQLFLRIQSPRFAFRTSWTQLFPLQLFLGYSVLVCLPISSGTLEGGGVWAYFYAPFQFQHINVVPSVKSIGDNVWYIWYCPAFLSWTASINLHSSSSGNTRNSNENAKWNLAFVFVWVFLFLCVWFICMIICC